MKMRISARNAAAAVGIVLLGCAVVAVLNSTSPPTGKEGVNREAGAGPGAVTTATGTPGQSGGEAATSVEGEPPRRTKGKERPSETVLAQQRLERRRLELVESLGTYRGAGFGERHPNVVKAREDLQKIEAEQTAAGAPR